MSANAVVTLATCKRLHRLWNGPGEPDARTYHDDRLQDHIHGLLLPMEAHAPTSVQVEPLVPP
jgi:hypothetical protein